MRILPPIPNPPYGFKDDEDEAWHEMHKTRLQLNAKFTCLGYAILLIVMAVAFIISLFIF